MPEMRVMLNELRTRFGKDPAWTDHIAQAERLYEGHARSTLTTLYDTIMAGGLPSTPENLRKLEEERRALKGVRE